VSDCGPERLGEDDRTIGQDLLYSVSTRAKLLESNHLIQWHAVGEIEFNAAVRDPHRISAWQAERCRRGDPCARATWQQRADYPQSGCSTQRVKAPIRDQRRRGIRKIMARLAAFF
jgi:hypothetical protein